MKSSIYNPTTPPPPCSRNPKTDRLVTRSLLLWAFFQGGLIITSAGFLGFFSTMMQEGWTPMELFGMRKSWEQKDLLLFDHFGKGWVSSAFKWELWVCSSLIEVALLQTYDERMEIMPRAQSSYFVGVVVAQLADVIVHKTRRVSLFQQGMRYGTSVGTIASLSLAIPNWVSV